MIAGLPHGFLPSVDPLRGLPEPFYAWEDLAASLPKLLVSDQLRSTIAGMPEFPIEHLSDDRETRRAMVMLSFLGAAYVWGEAESAHSIPPSLAVPWYGVATMLGRPPVLSYASYALDNWFRIDSDRPPELGNIGLIQNFGGGLDEEWFVLVHVEIEYRAQPALAAIQPIFDAVVDGETETVLAQLSAIGDALEEMVRVLRRMPEFCDPYVYFRRVRPYLHGWRDHPNLPEGLIYEGVDALGGKPQKWRGETGAQSSLVPTLDALLGVAHKEDPLRHYLNEMREYMPPEHRAFVASVEEGPSVREYVQNMELPELTTSYDRCVDLVHEFRSIHLEYAARYIARQASSDKDNPAAVGTGGTPFMKYLAKHRDETKEHRV